MKKILSGMLFLLVLTGANCAKRLKIDGKR
jgi:hypothetical protein